MLVIIGSDENSLESPIAKNNWTCKLFYPL